MATSETEIWQLLNRAFELPEGPLQVSLLDAAVRKADALGDLRLQLDARLNLITGAFCAGDGDKLFVSLTWCLGQSKETPDLIPWNTLLWQCKHALSFCTSYPHISLTEIDQLSQDVLDRYQQHGASQRGPLSFICRNYTSLGQLKKGEAYFKQWRAAPHDYYTECEAWERFFLAAFYWGQHDIDRAWEIAQEPLEQPERFEETFIWFVGRYIFEAVKRGELERAARLAMKSYRRCSTNPRYMFHASRLAAYLGLTRNFSVALRILETHLPSRFCPCTPGAKYAFDLNLWMFFRQLLATDQTEIKIRFPDAFPLYRPDGTYQTNELGKWFEASVREYEALFNARAENDYETGQIQHFLDYEEFAVDFPIDWKW